MRIRTAAFVTVLSLAGMGQALAQTRIITGRVVDSLTGEAVTSGQVSAQGMTVGTTIKDDGTFTLSVPPRDVTLSVRSIGFKRRDVPVAAGQGSVQVALERDYFQLEAIVVTGQATGVEKRNLANAVSTLSTEQLAKVPTAGVIEAIQGRLAGAQISQNSGAPGGGSIVRMRGVTSITGSIAPLYVVDGVIVSDRSLGTGTNLIIDAFRSAGISPKTDNQDNAVDRIADLNPEAIASVEVLKGAAASAIYGSKASNGVILITTKRGRVGAPQFSVGQRFGFSSLSRKIGVRRFSQADAVAALGPAGQASWTADFHDFEQELYGGKPLSYQTDGSMSGGTETSQYFASVLVKHEGGILPNTFADKQSLRLNLDQAVGGRLKISLSSEVIRSANDRGLTQNENNGAVVGSALGYTGFSWLDLRATCPDGSRKVQCEGGLYAPNPFGRSNPFQTVALFKNREGVWRVIGTGRMSLDAVSTAQHTLSLIATGGGDVFTQKNEVFSPPELFFEQVAGNPGSSALSYSQNQNFNVNGNVVDKYRLENGTSFTTQAGVQLETQHLNEDRTLARGLIGGLTNIDRAVTVQVNENRERVRDLGFFAQEELLALNERLLLTVGARADQSSSNADTKKLYVYPKAAASYRLPVGGLVDELKLRAAFGQSGNQPVYGRKFTPLAAGNLNGKTATTVIGGVAGAPDLRPEREREIEGGADVTLFGSRANLEATVYEKRVTDLLLQRTLAPTTGLSQLFFNGGVMRTRGLELALNVLPVQTTKFQWNARGTFSLSRCKIVSLPIPAFRPIAFLNAPVFGSTFIEPGKSCTQLIGDDTLGTLPGDAALGAIGTHVQRAVADANPKYNFSIANDLTYRSLELRFLWDRQVGGVLSNITQLEYDANQTSIDYSQPAKPGALTGEQRINALGLVARPYLQDVSYLRLREVTLTLDLPAATLRKIWTGARTARLSLSGRNLLTFTPYQGYDPENNQIVRSAAQGTPWDIWAYPPSRSFWLSLSLGF
ncbi:MAG: SusC/RagA family TonB-linked outer membrane protein [Gemmatimonadetes bacterium]|nr:SusC/RagA family TonB-linked outer membrane protein [Gemmatimonadota bacterium]